MKKLKTDYIDLVLLHQPFSDYYGTYRDIEDLEPDAIVLDGLAIRGGDMDSNQSDTVINWLESLGFYE